MAYLNIPDLPKSYNTEAEVKSFLNQRGIIYERWLVKSPLSKDADQDTILKAYESYLKPYMQKHGYKTADVVSVFPDNPKLKDIRKMFLREHTHTEDEVRFFVEGNGLFWFNFETEPVFSVLCSPGDLLSVPAKTKHWFDLGPDAHVRAIRVFTNPEGWVANYTDSKIDERYNPKY